MRENNNIHDNSKHLYIICRSGSQPINIVRLLLHGAVSAARGQTLLLVTPGYPHLEMIQAFSASNAHGIEDGIPNSLYKVFIC